MKKIKLSILVPIYNSAEFLPLCIESILNQSFKDFECLLINDGSTDNSIEVMRQYAKNDKRIKIIDKKNTGYGESLNDGIKKSVGEYIGIVEPDDFIHRDMYKKLFETETDIMKCGYMNFYGKTWKTNPVCLFAEVRKDFPANGTKINPEKNQKIFLVNPTVWSAVYKREMLEKNHIKFLETPGASYQDAGFQFKTFVSAKSVFCIEKPLYYYRQDNANSSVKSNKKVDAVKTEFDEIDKYIEKKTEFQNIADCCRFRSYNWNLNRLRLKEAVKFAKIAKMDYKSKNFNPNFFRKDNQYRAHELKFSTKHPLLYVFMRSLFKFYNNLKVTVRKIVKPKK